MEVKKEFDRLARKLYGRPVHQCTAHELYHVLLQLVKNVTEERPESDGKRKIYYISAEFLIGKLLTNNLINLGIYDEVSEVLKESGKSLAEIEDEEMEPSLGNGGLGRLAACFMDSIATLGLNGAGIGLNYHFGLFRQVFEDHLQNAVKDGWINDRSWLKKTDVSFDIEFGDVTVKSRMYDIDVVGYEKGLSKLHLFDVESLDESLVRSGIDFDKTNVEKNLTLFLYPDDSDEAGNLLRIYQQYFMVSNGARLIIKEMKDKGYDLHSLNEHVCIQINDTHPTMVIPELIRILTQEEEFTMDDAIDVVSKTCAYTNHTILAEALEKWPLSYLNKVVPVLVPIIKELANRIKKAHKDEPKVWIIDDEKRVHMAHIDIHYGFSVNGVAAIHTDILKNTELNSFYKLYPGKFNNKTNGVTFRRWLLQCDRPLADFLDKTIGTDYRKDADSLKKLLDFKDDEGVLKELEAIKKANKEELARFIKQREGIDLNTESIFDIQVKRLHEYKRQQMNALYIIHKYLEIKDGKKPERPITCIFGAKAAPAYVIAKDIIHLILVLQEIINNDPEVNQYLKVIMVTNYNVTYAEKLIPACDISEQISLASKEASGTSNMKFMLNGAVTLGTDDGANVEIHDLVGDDNIYIFGTDSDTVIKHYEKADYVSKDIYEKSEVVKEAVDFIISPECLKVGHKENLERLYKELLNKDWFMTLLDLEDYIKAKDRIFKDYENREKWRKMMLVNIAKAGFFSSDRTIAEYDRDIWKIKG